MQVKRRIFQFIALLLNNSYIYSLFKGTIYQGKLKYFCSPGLNCYSCPFSLLSCPIGAIQSIFLSLKLNLSLGKPIFGFYIFGFLGSIGILGGRVACGWVCPFGFLQDIIYKIPSRKFNFHINKLKILKFIILLLTVILFPMIFVDNFGYGEPYFCKYICPVGTLEGGVILPFLIPSLKKMIGFLYFYKIIFLSILLFSFLFIKRPFCRFLCPLGAIYSIFNKYSILKLNKIKSSCNSCMKCVKVCPMSLSFKEIPIDHDCIRCLECINVCSKGAIELKFKD